MIWTLKIVSYLFPVRLFLIGGTARPRVSQTAVKCETVKEFLFLWNRSPLDFLNKVSFSLTGGREVFEKVFENNFNSWKLLTTVMRETFVWCLAKSTKFLYWPICKSFSVKSLKSWVDKMTAIFCTYTKDY